MRRTAIILGISILSIGVFIKWRETRFIFARPVITTSSSDHNLRHLGIIMDGNRRWARKRNLVPWLGHKEGAGAVREAVDFCLEHKIPILSLYAFAIDNFKRPEQEKEYLFNLIVEEAPKLFDEIAQKGVKVCFVGDRALFPARVIPVIEDLEERTKAHTSLLVNILFCYGGRQEITAGIKELIAHVQAGAITVDTITDDTLNNYLWTGDLPPPDLIIRTGGVRRLSNFFTYNSGYSELYFTDTYWPDMTKKDLEKALMHFITVQRNFGT